MKIALIDHHDSFTHNIAAWLSQDEKICINIFPYGDKFSLTNYDALVLSPGPKSPSDYPLSVELLHKKLGLPIFGICLGMQMMLEAQGALIAPYSPPLHGKDSILNILKADPLFTNVSSLKVARYHSLIAKNIPPCFETLALSPEGYTMAILCEEKKQMGVQFHPESFLTTSSAILLKNLINWINACQNLP